MTNAASINGGYIAVIVITEAAKVVDQIRSPRLAVLNWSHLHVVKPSQSNFVCHSPEGHVKGHEVGAYPI
jgi:hypothetical protein